MTKKILDVTCGSRTIWFNKNHPAAIYCDVRDEECTGVWKSINRGFRANLHRASRRAVRLHGFTVS
nr:MAG TPA: putative AdoMet-dependent methyltransferase [Caudoviricetes sp.]